MALSRRGTGPAHAARALASQVHPVFMLPPLSSSLFGAVVAGRVALGPALVHAAAMFCAVYTAHVKDGLVDFYVRGEDDDHPMTRRGCRVGLVAAGVGFLLCLASLWGMVGVGAVLVTLPTWFVGYLHAPQLDTNPVTATAGYPLGIALAIVGGYYVQAAALAPEPLAYALVFFVLLTGVKVIDDAKDRDYDASIDKRTVAVVLGPRRARRFAHALLGAGMVAVLLLTGDGLFPPFALVAAVAFGLVAVAARGASPRLATMLLVRGTYVFLALLLVAVWFRPLAAVPLPDIGVLGGYTYLATEVAFGAVAFGLLARANALRRAAVTIAAVYPVAYLWDWYTLEVGVFAIPLRTGVELFGIPLEEHLFMVVVPALVLGVHETLASWRVDERTREESGR